MAFFKADRLDNGFCQSRSFGSKDTESVHRDESVARSRDATLFLDTPFMAFFKAVNGLRSV